MKKIGIATILILTLVFSNVSAYGLTRTNVNTGSSVAQTKSAPKVYASAKKVKKSKKKPKGGWKPLKYYRYARVDIKVMSRANAKSKKRGTIKYGTKIKIRYEGRGAYKNWVKIRYKNKWGYIKKKSLITYNPKVMDSIIDEPSKPIKDKKKASKKDSSTTPSWDAPIDQDMLDGIEGDDATWY